MPLTAPVIVVPGITASVLRDEYDIPPSDVWTTIFHRDHDRIVLHPSDLHLEAREPSRVTHSHLFPLVYEELIEELRDDLREDDLEPVPVYPFSYDWRMPLIQTQQRLKDFICEVIDRTRLLPHYRKSNYSGRPRVNLVAHSMGGLIVAGYLNQYGANFICKIVTIATPFQGSCDAIVEVATGTGNTIINPRKARKRRAARLTPALYHLLPTYDGAVNFEADVPHDIFDPDAWPSNIIRSIARSSRMTGISDEFEESEEIARSALTQMLAWSSRHRGSIDKLNLESIKMTPHQWLAIVGIGEETFLDVSIEGSRDDEPRFARIDESRRTNSWSRDSPGSRDTGDGTVPLRGAVPKFLDESNLVCVTQNDFLLGERYDPPPLRFAGFHAQIPSMHLVQRLIVRFLTDAENPYENPRGRPLPGIPCRDWNSPVS